VIERLLTLGEAAQALGCSVATVKRRVRSGSLPAFRDGRLVRIREDDLRRYVCERVARATAAGPTVTAGSTLAPGKRLWD
jgi:excisionase family DNA binding protein